MPVSATGTATNANCSHSSPEYEPEYDDIDSPNRASCYASSAAGFHVDASKSAFNKASPNTPRVATNSNGSSYAALDETGIQQGLYSKCEPRSKTVQVYDVAGLPDRCVAKATLKEKVSVYECSEADLQSDDLEAHFSEVQYDATKIFLAGSSSPYAALERAGIQGQGEYSICQSAPKAEPIGPPRIAINKAGDVAMFDEEAADYGKQKVDLPLHTYKPYFHEASCDEPRAMLHTALDEADIQIDAAQEYCECKMSTNQSPINAAVCAIDTSTAMYANVGEGAVMLADERSDKARSKAGSQSSECETHISDVSTALPTSANGTAASTNCSQSAAISEPVCTQQPQALTKGSSNLSISCFSPGGQL